MKMLRMHKISSTLLTIQHRRERQQAISTKPKPNSFDSKHRKRSNEPIYDPPPLRIVIDSTIASAT